MCLALHCCADSVLYTLTLSMMEYADLFRKHLLTTNWWEGQHETFLRLQHDRAGGRGDLSFIQMSHKWACSGDTTTVSAFTSRFCATVCCNADAHSHTRTCTHVSLLHILIMFEMTRWATQSWFSSLGESNSTQLMPPDRTAQCLHIRGSAEQSQPDLKKKRCSMCATVLEKSGSAERYYERTELCSPSQYLSGCGAHRPVSTTATPEIKIMFGLELWLHPRESPGEQHPGHVCFPLVFLSWKPHVQISHRSDHTRPRRRWR